MENCRLRERTTIVLTGIKSRPTEGARPVTWEYKRFRNMDAALTEIEPCAQQTIARLRGVGAVLAEIPGMKTEEARNTVARTMANEISEAVYMLEEIMELVNKGLTVPEGNREGKQEGGT